MVDVDLVDLLPDVPAEKNARDLGEIRHSVAHIIGTLPFGGPAGKQAAFFQLFPTAKRGFPPAVNQRNPLAHDGTDDPADE